MDTRFKKGQTPWNKGLHISLSPRTQFKKGMKPFRVAPSIDKPCAFCGKKMTLKIYLARVQCCSRSCASKYKLLNRVHWNWRGGRGTERHREMSKTDYKLWRTAVFMRDNFTCQICGERGIKLEADHIKSWVQYPELRYAIDNGRTLCVECHRKTDSWGFKGIPINERGIVA